MVHLEEKLPFNFTSFNKLGVFLYLKDNTTSLHYYI